MIISINGERSEVSAGITVAELVADLGLTPEQVAVECNGELVRRAAHAERKLAPGDSLELVTLVGGG